MDDIENQNSRKRRSWTQGETRAFIHAYAQRKAEFEHPRKKKTAMSNVLEDLVAQGVLGREATTEMLSNKMKNLKKAFKATKDNNNRTGEAASSAPFEDLMEELFGTRPEINNSHTLFCGSARKQTKGLPITPKRNFEEPITSRPSTPPSPSQPSTSISSIQPSQQPPTPQEMPLSPGEIYPTPSTSLPSTPSPSIPPSSSTKKKTLKEKYMERKLELKGQKNKIYERYLEQKIQKLEEMEEGRFIRLEMKKQFLKEVNDNRNVLPQYFN